MPDGMSDTEPSWISRREAEARLGVKSQTLYAYVSRGHISARPDPDNPRRSLYAVEDLLRLLDRSTPRDTRPRVLRAPRLSLPIDSAVSEAAETLVYRGHDALALADQATLERAARILWGAETDDPFSDQRPRVDVIFPGGPRARAFACLARRADEDGPSAGRSPVSLRREGASLLNELVDAVAGPGPRLHIHQRLARGWKVTERDAGLIRRALVLSCDWQGDASTLAVRVTTGSGASLAAACVAGLAALSGPELGGRLAQVTGFVIEALRSDARSAARNRLAEGLELPGFADERDARADALIEWAALPESLTDILRVGEGLTGRAPTFDLALALTARRLDLPRDGAFGLLCLGRTAGWLAHAMEQAALGSPILPRLRYVGPAPEQA